MDHLRQSGGAQVVRDLVRGLPSVGVPARLFVLQAAPDDVAQVSPDPSTPTTVVASAGQRLRRALLPGLLQLIRLSHGAGMVVSGSEVGYCLILGWLAARAARRPFAVLVQGNLPQAIASWVPRPLRRLTRAVHARADLSICVSPGLVPDVLATGLPAERVRVVPVGVDVDQALAAAKEPPELQLGPGPYLMAIGRLSAQKGFDTLIRAFAEARSGMPDHRLVIIGEGPDRAALEGLAAELEVADAVLLPGFVDNVHPLLAGADLFVLSSRYEGMGGLVLLEALVHGVPVIATDCPSGPRFVLRDGQLGDLVPVEDAGAMGAALLAHVRRPGRLRCAASAGPERAREFGPDRWIARMGGLLAYHGDRAAAQAEGRGTDDRAIR
jgi:glycosyltransferase involved in cell wall biosynthesis